jgi:thiol-disulfide isomerase/thioredoxin
LVVAATLAAASFCGLLLRRRNGRFRAGADEAFINHAGTGDSGATDFGVAQGTAIDPVLAGLGVTPGAEVTLLQFSSAFCAPCRTTRVLCAEVARTVPGVRYLEVDAESHLEAVRALGIWRTPTVLVLDGTGAVRQRASGAPTKTQLLGVIGEVLNRSDLHPADSLR